MVLLLTSNLPKTVVSTIIKREVEEAIIVYKNVNDNGNTHLFSHSLLTMIEKSLASRML